MGWQKAGLFFLTDLTGIDMKLEIPDFLKKSGICFLRCDYLSPIELGGNTLDKSRNKSLKLGRETVSLGRKILLTR